MNRNVCLFAAIGLILIVGNAWAADVASPPTQPAAADHIAPAPAPLQPFSVMYTPGETKAIEQAFADKAHPPPAEVAAQAQVVAAVAEARLPHMPNIYVSAVLDFGGGDWTVWANGLRVTPNQQSPLFRVVAVHGNSVEISVTSDGGTRVVLQPYQTWRSRQRDVVEGIFP